MARFHIFFSYKRIFHILSFIYSLRDFIYSLYIFTCCCNLVKVKEEYALILRLAYLLWLYSFTNILYYYSGFSYSLAIYMSYYLIFLALTVSKLVIYRRKKDYISHIKKPYGSEKACPLFGISCESIEIKKMNARPI